MDEPTNDTRAEWARQTLDYFRGLTRCDNDTAAQDLICNIGHLIDKDKEFGDSLQSVCDIGIGCYKEEAAEETEERSKEENDHG